MRPASGGGWIVELNPDTLPRVLVNTRYYARVSKGARNKNEKEFITERFNAANWLVKSLHQRAHDDPQGRDRDRAPAGRVLPPRRPAPAARWCCATSPTAIAMHEIDGQPRDDQQVPRERRAACSS